MGMHTLGKQRHYSLPHDGVFDPRSGPGLKGEIGSLAYRNDANGTIYQKFDTGDNDWRIISYGNLSPAKGETYTQRTTVDHTALPGSPQAICDVNLQSYSTKVLNDNGDQYFNVVVKAIGRQVADTGANTPEGAEGDSIIIEKSFGHLYDTSNGGFQSAIQTDKKIPIGAAGGGTNDNEMDIVISTPNAFTISFDAYNGLDNGGGDSGRTMEWVTSIIVSIEPDFF
jgi:hypothetical protein